ncbi:unnamed protein product [Bursaphelenchus xylophilus]|uniref:(pine wood nematode) hypothetical protein n=1 Tax=Bursaphelenchus xylophilus TaxID=6326 RepID=A0A1I7RP52_BURXY|nr:unnamed protein product [Bursaphelenchus xylophilus]CAG9124562.1 unnamed protein product [Bursaphelenchus xylophilus]
MKVLLMLGFASIAYSLNCFQHQQNAYIRVLLPPKPCPREAVSCFKVVNHVTNLATRSCSLTPCLSNGINSATELCVKQGDLSLCCCINNNCNGNFAKWENITNH